jgi:hypothetical protein
MKVRFLLNEHIAPAVMAGLKQRQPHMDVLCVSDAGAPRLGTFDPDILQFLETTQRALVTRNRRSMWNHVTALWQSGGHHWGIFWIPRDMGQGILIRQMLLIWDTSEAEEWRDQLRDLPF